MKKFPLILTCITVLSLGAACDSILDVEPHVITSEGFYASKEDAQAGLFGVYGVLNSYQLYGEFYSMILSYTDDLCYFLNWSDTRPTYYYVHDPDADEIYQVWTWLYKGINNANSFMEAVQNTDLDKDGDMLAQARFLRAYYHFLLAQTFGDVPLKTASTASWEAVKTPATSQYEVLSWVTSEMKEAIGHVSEDFDHAPSKVTKTAMEGILARVYLFLAGKSVSGGDKKLFYKNAMEQCENVIKSGRHRLNPDYSAIFINYIEDKYDTEYRESMWEVEFKGDRSSTEFWSNGRNGDINGLKTVGGDSDYSNYQSNWSWGLYGNTLKLWDLYMHDDRIMYEKNLGVVTDKRQEWNIPPYNYAGYTESKTRLYPYGGDPADVRYLKAGHDKTPYYTGSIKNGDDTNKNPLCFPAGRNIGKFRREVKYEGSKNFFADRTGINFPLLRYADVLLMYAEAVNGWQGAPTEAAYNCVKAVRDRAGISTDPFSVYADHDDFLKLIQNERGRELCFEAIRKYDLIRWGLFISEMKAVGKSAYQDTRWGGQGADFLRISNRITPKHIFMPIPSMELAVNTELKQNPLW